VSSLDKFFGLHIDPLTIEGKTWVVLLAALLGGLIGLERQWRGNAAGLRTHILVCLGSTVITLCSVEIGHGVRGNNVGDPGHIAAQIVSGVGFLGAGAIMRDGMNVHGITTAASVWATAGIGIALGASPHMGELGVVATLVVLATLIPLAWLEKKFMLKQDSRVLIVEVVAADNGPAEVMELLTKHKVGVLSVQSQSGMSSEGDTTSSPTAGATRHLRMTVSLPVALETARLSTALSQLPCILSFQIE